MKKVFVKIEYATLAQLLLLRRLMSLCLMSFCPAADEELFEDNPEEYIRRDIEGSGRFSFSQWFSFLHCLLCGYF